MGLVFRVTDTICMYENELLSLENIRENQYGKIYLLIWPLKSRT